MTTAEQAARLMHSILAELGPRYGWPTEFPTWDDLPANYQELTIVAMERLLQDHVFSTIDGKLEVA